jgi:hypothetical protein
MKKGFVLSMLLIGYLHGFAQTKQYIYGNQVWYGYYPQLRLSKHWGLWTDLELHSKEHFLEGVSQFVFRFAGTYYITDRTKLTAGYGYSNTYPADNHLFIAQPEHHAWEQLQWYTLHAKKKMMEWLRLEERYKQHVENNYTLANYYDFSYRIRYELNYQLPLSPKGVAAHQFSLALGEEIYINFGKKIVNNYFDQNRLFGGISYMVNDHDNIVLGYMNQFQQLPAGNQYKNFNVIRLSFYQNLYTGSNKKEVNEIKGLQ